MKEATFIGLVSNPFKVAMEQLKKDPDHTKPRGQRSEKTECLITGILLYMLDNDGMKIEGGEYTVTDNQLLSRKQESHSHFTAEEIAGFIKSYSPDLSYTTGKDGTGVRNALYFAANYNNCHGLTSDGRDVFTLLTEYAVSSGQKEALIHDNGGAFLPMMHGMKHTPEASLMAHVDVVVAAGYKKELSRTNRYGKNAWHQAVDNGLMELSAKLEPYSGLNAEERKRYVSVVSNMVSEQKRKLLKADKDDCYMALIDAGYTEDETPSEADVAQCRQRLEKLFAEAEAISEPITKKDLMHLDKFGEPFMTFEEALRNFPWIVAKLKATTGETFTVEELGDKEYGDGTEDHQKATILGSAGEEQLLGEIFKPENWVGRAQDCKKLHKKIPDTFKDQVDLKSVLQEIAKIELANKLAAMKPLTNDTSLTKEKLYAKDADGFSAFDHPDNIAGLQTLNTLLANNKQGPITFDELVNHQTQNGDCALFKIVATAGIDAAINLSVATGEPLTIPHLMGREFNNGPNNGKSVMDKIIEREELEKIFPVPGDSATTQVWVNRPRDMKAIWNLISKTAKKDKLTHPDFDTRLNLVNGFSLANTQQQSSGIEL